MMFSCTSRLCPRKDTSNPYPFHNLLTVTVWRFIKLAQYFSIWSNTSNTKDRVQTHFKTQRRGLITYMTLNRAFLTNFDVWKCGQTLFRVFDLSSHSKLNWTKEKPEKQNRQNPSKSKMTYLITFTVFTEFEKCQFLVLTKFTTPQIKFPVKWYITIKTLSSLSYCSLTAWKSYPSQWHKAHITQTRSQGLSSYRPPGASKERFWLLAPGIGFQVDAV